jgi:hypothetical protein
MSSNPDCASVSASHKDTAKMKLLQMSYRSNSYERYLKESSNVSKDIAEIKIAMKKHPHRVPSYHWSCLSPSERTSYTIESRRLEATYIDFQSRLNLFKIELTNDDVPKYGVATTASREIIDEYWMAYDMFHQYIAICEKLKTKLIWTSEFDERLVRFEGGRDICPVTFSREFINLLCINGFHVKYTKINRTQTTSHGDSFRFRECPEIYAITHKLVVSCCGGLEIDETTINEDPK